MTIFVCVNYPFKARIKLKNIAKPDLMYMHFLINSYVVYLKIIIILWKHCANYPETHNPVYPTYETQFT